MPSEGERAPELLRADREQLDRAAVVLGGDESALVLLVCGKPLIPAALKYLRERARAEIPEPVVLQGSEEALGALVGAMPELAEARLRSLALGGDAKEALRALNWHREKLLRGPPVVLWLDGVDGLTEMREAAPDAYSFRDMVVLVRGDGGRLPQVPRKQSQPILEARRRLSRARTALERAISHNRLSDVLRTRGYLVEAETVAKRGLEFLPEKKYSDENARIVRARLWSQVALAARQRGSQKRQREAAMRGLDEIQGMEAVEAQVILSSLLVTMPGAFGAWDRTKVEQAFLLLQELRLDPNVYTHVIRAIAGVCCELGDFLRIYELFNRLDIQGVAPLNLSYLKIDQGQFMTIAGRMIDAESCLMQGIAMGKEEGVVSVAATIAVAQCWLYRGELHVAEQIVNESLLMEPTYLLQRQAFGATLAITKGEGSNALKHARGCLLSAAEWGLDGEHLEACGALARIASESCDANCMDANVLERIVIEMEVAEEVSRSLVGSETLPWYPIRLLGFRADVLIHTERRSEALDIAKRALRLARDTCNDLIPECGRSLADVLIRAGKLADVLPVLAETEPQAVSRGMLKELACIRATRVLALVLLNQPSSMIESAMKALREAMESSGAPKIKAEILLDLAIRLPPTTTLPDPLALATETHALFVEMPIPAKEARSLELAGDILAARGKPAEAKRRYLLAQGILERRGLGLRLPLLKTKLEQLG